MYSDSNIDRHNFFYFYQILSQFTIYNHHLGTWRQMSKHVALLNMQRSLRKHAPRVKIAPSLVFTPATTLCMANFSQTVVVPYRWGETSPMWISSWADSEGSRAERLAQPQTRLLRTDCPQDHCQGHVHGIEQRGSFKGSIHGWGEPCSRDPRLPLKEVVFTFGPSDDALRRVHRQL